MPSAAADFPERGWGLWRRLSAAPARNLLSFEQFAQNRHGAAGLAGQNVKRLGRLFSWLKVRFPGVSAIFDGGGREGA